MTESKNWVIGLVVLIALALGAGIWLLNSEGENGDNTAAVGNISRVEVIDSLTVNDQFPGAIVYVTSVTFKNGGWVVIKKEDPSTPLGASQIIGTQYFNQGTDVGVVNLTTLTEEGKNYTASLYSDNGDKVFDPTTDSPLKNIQGQEIIARFLATQNLPEIKG